MENFFTSEVLLDQFQVPAFTVVDGKIQKVNLAAQQRMICADTPAEPLLGTYADTYRQLENGCLCAPLHFNGYCLDFCIYKADGIGYFIANTDTPDDLRGMALAAGTMRTYLSNISALADMLCAEKNPLAAELNREVYRMSRLVCNMSDAAGLQTGNDQRLTDLSAAMAEIFDKASAHLEQIGITLHYKGIRKSVRGYADPVLLERAILNLVSNSVKFTPVGGHIYAVLSQHGKHLHLTMWDTGESIDPKLLPTIFSRYRREGTVEDSRHGVGLGLLIVCNIARAHGGSLFIEYDKELGSRITLTLAISSTCTEPLVSALLVPDYAGGRDHALQELSDVLPARLYE